MADLDKKKIMEVVLLYTRDHGEKGIMATSGLTLHEIKEKTNGSINTVSKLHHLIESMEKVGLLAQQPYFIARQTAPQRTVRTRPYKLTEEGQRLAEQLSQGQTVSLPEPPSEWILGIFA